MDEMTIQEIQWMGDTMARLKCEPGDVFVMKFDRPLSKDMADRVREYWSGTMGDAKLLILDVGVTLGVARSTE
jgi:hypothetical protein